MMLPGYYQIPMEDFLSFFYPQKMVMVIECVQLYTYVCLCLDGKRMCLRSVCTFSPTLDLLVVANRYLRLSYRPAY